MSSSIIDKDPCVVAFRNKRVKHASLERALNSFLRLVESARPESVVVLIGPSGVGKSTLVGALERHLVSHYAAQMQSDPGFLPYISIRAPTPLDGNFNWKDLFIRSLYSAGEVLISRKVLPHFEVELDGDKMATTKGMVREELRRSLESLVRHRKVPAIIIDEASAILRVKSGFKPLLQFEILKSLAVELRIPIILVGAYDLLGVLEGAGQLVRRCDVIHFPRYVLGHTFEQRPDEARFKDVLHALLGAIQIDKEPGLIDHVDFFMAKSIGCVGVLKDWLDRALVEALSSAKLVLTRDIIERSALSNKKLIGLLREAKTGELRLADLPDDDLASELGLSYVPSLQMPCPEQAAESSDSGKAREKSKGRVGKRGPSRDPVGEVHA